MFLAVLVHADHGWDTLLFSFYVNALNKIFQMNVSSCELVDAHTFAEEQ